MNGQRTTLKNTGFEQILSVLPQKKFCRINKKDIIALKTVQRFTSDEVKTSINTKNNEGITLPLSDVYREEFKQKIQA